jgi:hypothetical protein
MVLAHGGGLPEAATVLVPLLVVAAFVVQERRNVRRLREQEEGAGGRGPRKDAED